jgi:uncharacterized protein involved in response to NO
VLDTERGVIDGNHSEGVAWARFPVFAYGFRTFFPLAAAAAVVLVSAWLAGLLGIGWPGDVPAVAWHAHEMLFGFVGAAVAGFLMTAVPSWTGMTPVAGARLALLALLWLLGRLASLPPFAASPAAAVLDIAFLPATGALLAGPLIAAGKLRNTAFLALLVGLALANLLIRLEWIGWAAGTAAYGTSLALGIVLVMVSVIGGRILPTFTQNALRESRPELAIPSRPRLDRATILATVLMVAMDLALPGGILAVLLTGAAALLHAVRLAGWHSARTLSRPLLWVLHLGYAWIPVALALKLAAALGLGWGAGWIHALTVGAFATMILAVSSRAALGHTGRPLVAPRAVVASFLLISAAALLRTVLDALPAGLYVPALLLSGLAWIGAFLLWLWAYAPILFRPRADGEPG